MLENLYQNVSEISCGICYTANRSMSSALLPDSVRGKNNYVWLKKLIVAIIATIVTIAHKSKRSFVVGVARRIVGAA